jgi:hypothetical protein
MTYENGVHERSDPELPINQEGNVSSTWCETPDDTRHEVSNDDQVANGHAEALDGDGGVEDDGEIRIRHLREGCK